MPKGDGTGPKGQGPMTESGCCEGRGRTQRHECDEKRAHAHGHGSKKGANHEEGCCNHEHKHNHRHGKCDHHHKH